MLADSLSDASRLRDENVSLREGYNQAIADLQVSDRRLVDYLLNSQGRPALYGNTFPTPEVPPASPISFTRRTARELIAQKEKADLDAFYAKGH